MKTSKIFGLGLAATAAFGLFAVGASAQQPPPAPAAPAKVVPKTAPTPPPVKAEAPVTAPKAAAKAADPSPCKGLVEAACKAKADVCGWIVPKKVDAKTGVADKPYCRKVAGIAKKAVPATAPKADAKAAPKVDAKAAVPKATTKAVPPPAATK